LKATAVFKRSVPWSAGTPPGRRHSAAAGGRGYGLQSREKQKVKRNLRRARGPVRTYFEEADRRKGSRENLLVMLERRVGHVSYRPGLRSLAAQARQFVRHGHVLVDGKKISIPSYQVKAGQSVVVKAGEPKNASSVRASRRHAAVASRSGWSSTRRRSGKVLRLPLAGIKLPSRSS